MVDPPLAVVLVGSQRGALMSALFIVAFLDHLDYYEDGLPPLGWIVPPEDRNGGEPKRSADVSAPIC